jgi:DNA polymerase III alpha subunit (gram-positive type)
MKYLFVDVETTGRYPNKHSVREIALLYHSGNTTEYFTSEFKFQDALIQTEAFTATNFTMEKYIALPDVSTEFPKVVNFLDKYINKFDKTDKAIFCAWNAKFDKDFCFHLFKSQNIPLHSYVEYMYLDIMPLAWYKLYKEKGYRGSAKLEDVYNFLMTGNEMDKEEWHRADFDVRATYKIAKELNLL